MKMKEKLNIRKSKGNRKVKVCDTKGVLLKNKRVTKLTLALLLALLQLSGLSVEGVLCNVANQTDSAYGDQTDSVFGDILSGGILTCKAYAVSGKSIKGGGGSSAAGLVKPEVNGNATTEGQENTGNETSDKKDSTENAESSNAANGDKASSKKVDTAGNGKENPTASDASESKGNNENNGNSGEAEGGTETKKSGSQTSADDTTNDRLEETAEITEEENQRDNREALENSETLPETVKAEPVSKSPAHDSESAEKADTMSTEVKDAYASDKSAPEIILSGLSVFPGEAEKNGTILSTEASKTAGESPGRKDITGEAAHPVIVVKDEYIDSDKTEVRLKSMTTGVEIIVPGNMENGQLIFDCGNISEDDRYKIRVVSEDKAGNRSENEWRFSVNQMGTKFIYDESRKNGEVNLDYRPTVTVENVDEVEIISVMLNGAPAGYTFDGKDVTLDTGQLVKGHNTLTLKVRDARGRTSQMEPWEFYCGKLYEASSHAIIEPVAANITLQGGILDIMKKAGKNINKNLICAIMLILVLSVTFILGGCGSKKTEPEVPADSTIETLADSSVEEPTQMITETPTPTPEPTVVQEESSEESPAAEIVAEAVTPEATPTPEVTPTETPKTGNGHKVAIDPGHQLHGDNTKEPIGPGASATKARVTSGTTGISSGLDEYELNLIVGLKLRDELINRGYEVYMTRETHEVDISNMERAKAAAESGSEILIRIHANGSDDTSVHGALTYEPSSSNPYLTADLINASQRLSKLEVDDFCAATGAKNLGTLEGDDMSGINWSTIPVTIIELGFMSNSEEDLKMASADYQTLMVQGMANGIDDYFS